MQQHCGVSETLHTRRKEGAVQLRNNYSLASTRSMSRIGDSVIAANERGQRIVEISHQHVRQTVWSRHQDPEKDWYLLSTNYELRELQHQRMLENLAKHTLFTFNAYMHLLYTYYVSHCSSFEYTCDLNVRLMCNSIKGKRGHGIRRRGDISQ